jgi:hypothetical protein
MKAKTDLTDDMALARHLATYAFGSTGRRGSKQSGLALLAFILLVVLGTSLYSQGQSQNLLGEDGAEFMAVFTHGELESLDPIVEEVSAVYRLLGRGVLWARRTWS